MTEGPAHWDFPPIRTERLVLRAPIVDDLEPLWRRRNNPAVAHYQNWTLPYPRERAEAIVKAAVSEGGPTDGAWWMATVTEREGDAGSGSVVGDLAINLSWGGRAAEIGYSLDPDRQGRGYAVEAVEALLDYLFEVVGIRRASAMLHPDNVPSAQVLERVGFQFEGQTRQSFFEGDGQDAETSDDALYGMTFDDRAAWLDRPTDPPDEVTLVEIGPENFRDVMALATHRSQERLVAPVANSYANALFPPVRDGVPVVPWFRAIQADGEPVGFVMLALPSEAEPDLYLWRLLVDRRHQRRGIGGLAVDAIESVGRDLGVEGVRVSWVDERGGPGPFYLARGYQPTGEESDGETEARKPLDGG